MKFVRTGMVWCSAFAGYLLFAGTVSSHELATSAALAAGAVAWSLSILHCSSRRYALTPAHAVAWLKATAGLVAALGSTLLVFIKAAALGTSPGRALELPFLRGAEDDPEDRARRATAVLIASLAPDNFVVRAPPHKDRVLVHTIVPGDATRDSRWLTS
ncbi:MAG TPA: hypothetical protein VFL45_05950 [Gammaproteobacteria bacterium]|jgi:hypothetical protein|nr:hypothetical protein [Gammaproteobacteria bacterium]